MHYLTFGSVVSISDFDDFVLLMITDWNCTDEEGNRWDYMSVPEMLGWTFLESEDGELVLENHTDAVFFNHENIEKIFFVGPPNANSLELEKEAFEDAKKNNLPIAQFYKNNEAAELQVSFDVNDRPEPYIIPTVEDEGKQYLPIGTVCLIDVSDKESEKADLQHVMIVAIKPYYLASDYSLTEGKDYRVMSWEVGYLASALPICINNEDIIKVVSIGYVNADVQFALQSEIVTNDQLWNEVLSSDQ